MDPQYNRMENAYLNLFEFTVSALTHFLPPPPSSSFRQNFYFKKSKPCSSPLSRSFLLFRMNSTELKRKIMHVRKPPPTCHHHLLIIILSILSIESSRSSDEHSSENIEWDFTQVFF